MSTSNPDRYKSYIDALKILTPREIEVMDLVIKGLTSLEIANKLSLSKHTIDTHKKNIALKLELGGSKAIIKWHASIPDQATMPVNRDH